MNYLVLTAGVIASFATIGHFVIGTKEFLRPVLNSNIADIPKKVMQSLFHYMSVFMILTSIILITISIGQNIVVEDTNYIVKIIGIIYGGFAIVQFYIALTSSVKMGVFKMFQWIFWTLIAIFSLIG